MKRLVDASSTTQIYNIVINKRLMNINKYESAPTMRTIQTVHSYRSPAILTRRKRTRPKLTLPSQTQIKRISQGKEVTILRIKFGSIDRSERKSQQRSYIRESDLDSPKFPFLRARSQRKSDNELENLGYDPDTRIASEVYEDKVAEKKKNYSNKMQTLKKQLERKEVFDKKRQQLQRSRIKVKLLAENLKRRRERQSIRREEIKGKKLLQSLLINFNEESQTATI